MSYTLDGTKDTQNVASFIQIVIFTIIGMCPSINVEGLENKIADVAYGLIPKFEIVADNVKLTFEGGAKNNLDVVLEPVNKK